MFIFRKSAAAGASAALCLCFGCGSSLPAEALAAAIFTAPEKSPPTAPAQTRLVEIGKYDVIIFIDSSRSMSRTVGPERPFYLSTTAVAFPDGVSQTESRWQWCSEQTETLSKQLQNLSKEHLTDHLKVVLFNSTYKEYKDVDLASVPSFFASNRPAGETNATVALRSQLRNYFAACDKNNESPRPLLVAMITDGCPDDPTTLRQTIIDATKKMKNAEEIAITFLQVGVDPGATKYLHELDHNLVGPNRAAYDIVTCKTFEQVNSAGLAESLLEAVHK